MNDDKKKPTILPAKSDSTPSSHEDEERKGSFAGAVAPFHNGVRASTKPEAKNGGSTVPPRTPAAQTVDNATSSSLEEAVERHRWKDKARRKIFAGGRIREGRNFAKNDGGDDPPRTPAAAAAATVDNSTASPQGRVAGKHHGKDRSSQKRGAGGGRIREGRPFNTDQKQPAILDRGVQLAPGVAYPGAERDAFDSRLDGAASSAPIFSETIVRNSGQRDIFDSLEAGAALPALSSGDAISLNASIQNADDGETQDVNGRAPLPSNLGGARLSLDPANAFDAYVVKDAPTEESRLAALNRLTRDAPLAEIVNVIDAENATSSSNRSEASLFPEEQRQKLLFRGGFILLLVLTATLISLAGLGRLSKSTSIPSLLETMDPSGVPSMAPTSGAPSMAPTTPAPSMAPTTPAPTSDAFSIMASRIFTNPEEERPRDPASPQWQALMWLAYEDEYNTTISYQLVRRYALATLYYATNGTG
jgi:hypothetical protein